MIDMKNRYYVTIAFRNMDAKLKPDVGSIVESKGILFSVKVSTSKWVALIAVIRNKVEYLDCLKRFKQDTPIFIREWYPMSVREQGYETYMYEEYAGNIVFIGSHEIISSRP